MALQRASETSARTTTAIARCEHVSVVHGRTSRVAALRDATLQIVEGERVALSGPSGSGKTTLLHALGGLVLASSGAVILDGRPLSTLSPDERARLRARTLAYVFQEPSLLPTLSALENVAFAVWAARAAGGEGSGYEPAELLALVGLERKLHHLPGELSGGEAQRVAIARALASAPRLLLCDEPTGHLDADTGGRVLDLLDALQKRERFALVVSTHDVDVASRQQRLVSLEGGRLVDSEDIG